MASPQPEHGHTDIAHDLLEAIARAGIDPGISAREYQFFLAVIRETYGWKTRYPKPTMVPIPLSRISDITGIKDIGELSQLASKLQKRRMIFLERRHGKTSGYWPNKDYKQWQTIDAGTSTCTEISTDVDVSTSTDAGTSTGTDAGTSTSAVTPYYMKESLKKEKEIDSFPSSDSPQTSCPVCSKIKTGKPHELVRALHEVYRGIFNECPKFTYDTYKEQVNNWVNFGLTIEEIKSVWESFLRSPDEYHQKNRNIPFFARNYDNLKQMMEKAQPAAPSKPTFNTQARFQELMRGGMDPAKAIVQANREAAQYVTK